MSSLGIQFNADGIHYSAEGIIMAAAGDPCCCGKADCATITCCGSTASTSVDGASDTTGADPPFDIPPDRGTGGTFGAVDIAFDFTGVPTGARFCGFKLDVEIEHESFADLIIKIIAPRKCCCPGTPDPAFAAISITNLADGTGTRTWSITSQDNTQTEWPTSGLAASGTYYWNKANYGIKCTPGSPTLNIFDDCLIGALVDGEWRLQVSDTAFLDSGQVNSANLTIYYCDHDVLP